MIVRLVFDTSQWRVETIWRQLEEELNLHSHRTYMEVEPRHESIILVEILKKIGQINTILLWKDRAGKENRWVLSCVIKTEKTY